jgi:hypothetical protein
LIGIKISHLYEKLATPAAASAAAAATTFSSSSDMSSDIDDDGDYSSIDGRDPKMEIKNGAIVNNVCDDQSADSEGGGGSDALKKKLQQQSASSHPAYSNIPSMETGNDKSLSKREKNRYR